METGPVLNRAVRGGPLANTGMLAALDFLPTDRTFPFLGISFHRQTSHDWRGDVKAYHKYPMMSMPRLVKKREYSCIIQKNN